MDIQIIFASILPDRSPWFIIGPLLGILTAGFFLVMNQPLGASGAYTQTLNFVQKNGYRTIWRIWYFVGMAAGGLIVTQGVSGEGGRWLVAKRRPFRHRNSGTKKGQPF